MLRKCFVIVCLILSYSASCQITGIAGSKLVAYNTSPLAVRTVEFEPTFSIFRSSDSWGENGIIQSDTIDVASSICWRLTYAASEALEVGMSTMSDLSLLSLSAKYKFYEKGSISFGLMAGVNVPAGNRQSDKNLRQADDIGNYGLGLIASYDLGENTSLDLNLSYVNALEEFSEVPQAGIFAVMDIGTYSFVDDLQFMLSTSYQSQSLDLSSQNLWTVYPGIAYEGAERYVIVLSTTHTLTGKNIPKGIGYAITFTTIWE